MKTKLLICLAFFTINLNAETHFITWSIGYNETLNIDVGDTVQWNFVGFHNVTSMGVPSFTSSGNQSGGSYSFTFNTVGDYDYFCGIHGLANMSGTISVTSPLGIDDKKLLDNFSIFPNPSSDILNFKLPDTNEKVNINIFDLQGKKIHTIKAFDKTNIYVGSLDNGVYLINLIIGNNKATRLFVKK